MTTKSDERLPNLAARRFEDIDFSAVMTEGRRYLCLDLDNTLLPQKGMDISDTVKKTLESLLTSGLVADVCLISNVILPGHRVKRLYRLAQELSISKIVPGFFWNRKPKRAPFLKALELLNARPHEVVMIGDQIFSDIVGGNRTGLYTIWLEPMASDHWSTLIVGRRRREVPVILEMKKRGMLWGEPDHSPQNDPKNKEVST